MRIIFRLVVMLVALAIIGLVIGSFMALSNTPTVTEISAPDTSDLGRAKTLLRQHDPRKLRAGETRTVSMSQQDLSLVLQHLLDRGGNGGQVAAEFGNSIAAISASLPLGAASRPPYINLVARVYARGSKVGIEDVRLGRLRIPDFISEVALVKLQETIADKHRAGAALRDAIQSVSIQPEELSITYEWRTEIADAVRDTLVSAEEQQLLETYYGFLGAQVRDYANGHDFSTLLRDMFTRAKIRSQNNDPVAENRAAILVIAAWIDGSSLTPLTPAAENWPSIKPVRLRLAKRRDLVQHFSTSAALAATGGSTIANAVGLVKEIDDADGGSGFSFVDLTADLAGTRFGELAVASAESARALQRRVASGLNDGDLLPELTNLEEQLNATQFQERYGGVEGEAYKRVVTEIERRLARLGLYQN